MSPLTASFLRPRALSLFLAIAAGTACAPAPATVALAGGPVSVKARVALKTSGGYRLMSGAGVEAYSAHDVAYLKVYLTRGTGGEQALGTFPLTDAPLEIKNLKLDTHYTVRLEAFKADDTRIDANADDHDGDPEGCEMGFDTSNVLTVDLTDNPFKLALLDQVFAGSASGTVAIAPGAVIDSVEAEELILALPEPTPTPTPEPATPDPTPTPAATPEPTLTPEPV